MPKNKRIVAAAYDAKAAMDLAAALMRGGLRVEAYNGPAYHPEAQADAVVYNMESFFMEPQKEYEALRQLFDAAPEDAICFVKSDSSLRGNLGSELAALKDGRGVETLLFVPALPKAQKFTQAGMQYQLEAAENKHIPLADGLALLGGFGHHRVLHGPLAGAEHAGNCIYIVDCTSQTELDQIAEKMSAAPPTALAGTGALAEKLGMMYAMALQEGVPKEAAPMNMDGEPGILLLDILEWRRAN